MWKEWEGGEGGGGVSFLDLFGRIFGFFGFLGLFIDIGYLGLISDGFRIFGIGVKKKNTPPFRRCMRCLLLI